MITSFGQDWGALVGLRLVAAEPERYERVAIGNGGLPTGDRPPNEGQPHVTIEGAGHFLQEDAGERLARIIASFTARG